MVAFKDMIVKGQKVKAGEELPEIDRFELEALKRMKLVGSKPPQKAKAKK